MNLRWVNGRGGFLSPVYEAVVTEKPSGNDCALYCAALIAMLLNAADYKLERIVPTMAPQSVIEAIAN